MTWDGKNITTKTDERVEAVIKSLRSGSTVVAACEAAKVDRVDFYVWMREDPKLKNAVEEAKKSRIQYVEDSLYMKALSGNIVACIFYLKNKAGWKDVTPQGDNNTVQVIIQNNVTNVQDNKERGTAEGITLDCQAGTLLSKPS